jgi:STE24 endopeptidase
MGVAGDRARVEAQSRGVPAPLSPWRRYRADAAEWFSPEEVARGRAYHQPVSRMNALQGVMAVAVMVAFVGGETADDAIDALGASGWVVELMVVIGVLEGLSLLFRPWFSGWRVFVHDRRWALSTQRAGGFVADLVKELLLTLVLTGLLAVPLYALIRATDRWWLWGWLLFSGFGVLFGFLFPVVFAPIFNRFEALEDDDVAPRVREVARRAGLDLEGVYVADASRRSRATNAYVAGLGRTRRVVLFDTLLAWPPALIEQVVAHELGHWRHRHLSRQVPLLVALQFVAFYALGRVMSWDRLLDWIGVDAVGDPRTYPVLFLVYPALLGAASLGLAWLGRAFERQADLHALDVLADPDAFTATFRRLAEDNKADVDPPWWRRIREVHPPVPERMAMARAWSTARSATD